MSRYLWLAPLIVRYATMFIFRKLFHIYFCCVTFYVVSDYNGFDELSNWSGQATPTQKLPATCAEVDGRTLGGGQPRGVGHAVALDMDSAKLVDACTAAFPRISVPALSNRNNGSNYDKRSKQNSAAHLPPSELETRLDNISMVEALNRYKGSFLAFPFVCSLIIHFCIRSSAASLQGTSPIFRPFLR